jgi:protein kinase-like protein/PEGA domain-containing protein
MARVLGATLLSLLAGAGAAPAAEWFEAYRDGVAALAAGQPMRAVTLLEFAASERPRPGRNVITYGTNVEPRYYPYVRLAEAYLQVNDLAGARSAITRSEKWGLEPLEERRKLAARVDELAARLAPPPAAAPSLAPPAAAPEPPPPTTLPAPVAVLPSAEPPRAAAEGRAILVPVPSPRPTPAPRATPSARPTAVPASPSVPAPESPAAVSAAPPRPVATPQTADLSSCSLDVVSQPPGASVYLDDELIGTTDPEWGRLIRSGIEPGRHRVRLSLAGHRDVTEEIVLDDGAARDFRRRLAPLEAPRDYRPLLFGAVAAVLLAVTAWALRRRGDAEPTPLHPRIFTNPTPGRLAPPDFGSNPGVRREADGSEFFGEYRLLAPLGRGGMASVYKAERRGEIYALKRPLPVFLDEPEFLERFQREAEIGRTLHHPNIVRILERGAVEGVPYFTMELVAGETLADHLHHAGALDPRLATGIVVQVAEALDYAHLKGVVHRDLKPSNVMVLEDGMAKVMDYGIARARRFEGLTLTGAFLGSPEYVAPEAIEGQVIDARSDLYSLGVIFYEALTGRRPFNADTPFAVLRKHLTEDPPPPSRIRPGIPEALERIVLRLLDKHAEKRHAGAEELVLELRDFLNQAA